MSTEAGSNQGKQHGKGKEKGKGKRERTVRVSEGKKQAGLEQAKQACRELLLNPTGRHAYSAYLQNEGISYFPEFWVEVERFKEASRLSINSRMVGSIYSTYVHEGAPKEIPLTEQERREIINSLKRPKKKMFDGAQEKVFELLFNDSYGRFIFMILQKKAQRSLKSGENMQEGGFLGLGDCFCLTDPEQEDNPIIAASDGFVNVTGYSREKIIPFNCRFLQGPDTDKEAIRRMASNIREGKECTELILNYKKDDTPFWNLLYICPLKDSFNETRFFLGGQVDVTKNINSNSPLADILEALEEQKALNPSLFPSEASSDSFVSRLLKFLGLRRTSTPKAKGPGAEEAVVDPTMDLETQKTIFLETYSNFVVFDGKKNPGTILFVSPRFTEITGFERSRVLGKGPSIFKGPLTNETDITELKECMKKGSQWAKEVICYDAKGLPHRTKTYLTPVKDLTHKTAYFVAVMKWEEATEGSDQDLSSVSRESTSQKGKKIEDCAIQ